MVQCTQTNDHQYLHYQSSHPQHIKLSIPYSQALRVSRICLSEKDFRAYICKKKEWFLARGYPEIAVNGQIDKVFFGKKPTCQEKFLLWLQIIQKLEIFEVD